MATLTTKHKSLVGSFDEILHYSSILSKGCEAEFMMVVRSQEECRRRWCQVEQESMGGREQFMKLIAERDALQTKLKHARNQVESEMTRRKRAESSQEDLERQIALIRELLANDNNKMNTLSDKERESLLFLSHNAGTPQVGSGSPTKRLSAINEKSADLLSASDLDPDHTEDDLDVSVLRDGKKWKRKKRKPSAPPLEEDTPPKKNGRLDDDTSIVTTTVTVPQHGPITATTNVEKPGKYRRSASQPILPVAGVQEEFLWMSPIQLRSTTPTGKQARSHTFCTKTVIKPESCDPCGKRIKFGKYALKCKDCRLVCHPDCKDNAALPCFPTTPGTPNKAHALALDEFAPRNPPYVPSLVIHCVSEIESRGLAEEGLYRLSGSEREVKELKEKLILKNEPHLEKVHDIHSICGALKDFFRNLPEPLVTFKLHGAFMRAGELSDADDSTTAMYQAVSELPQTNRDTMAYLVTHLQRVSESPECKMPVSNLARVFGPTIIGHSCPDPDPMQMLSDTKTHPRVVERLMSLPSDFWKAFINFDVENAVIGNSNVIDHHNATRTPITPGTQVHSTMLGPVRTPGKTPGKTPSNNSLGKAKSLLGKTSLTPSMKKTNSKSSSISSRFGAKSDRSKKGSHFFASPTLR